MIKKLLNISVLTLSILAITIASFSYTIFAENNDKINSYEREYKNDFKILSNKTNNCKSIDFNFNNYINNNIQKSNTILGSTNVYVDINSYPIIQNYDINNTTEHIIYDNLDAYIYQDSSGVFQLDINSNYPIYVTVLGGLFNSYEIYTQARNQICLPFDNLSFYTGTAGMVKDVLVEVAGLILGGNSSIIKGAITYGDLYKMGYRIYATDPNTLIGMSSYVYVIAKMDDYERIHYYGYTDASYSGIQDTIYFDRLTFLPSNYFSNYYNNQNVSYYTFILNSSDLGLSDFNSTLIYDSNNLLFCSKVTNTQLILGFLPGQTDYYLTLCRYLSFYNNHTGHTNFNRNSNIIYDDEYTSLNSNSNTNYTNQLNTINTNLVDIKTLLSDLQVVEINTIYNDIINNYNIDIDNEINNYIDDLKLDLLDLDINNPKFSLPLNINSQLTGLKDSFSNIFTCFDNSGGAIFYIVPIVALIIGALL